jgi:hydroxymethylpyrimidine/phosphomethylpyrimidine kinase
MDTIARALTIAGSDSGGGAGIQADLKTFTALGVYGASAITALTAQNTLGVQGVFSIPADFVEEQIAAVLDDIGADAAKTGMLANNEIIRAVARALESRSFENLVVDPVMVSKSGHPLLEQEARNALKQHLLPLALVVTPNLFEAEQLAGFAVRGLEDMKAAARLIRGMGPRYVVIKGGHLPGKATDILFDGETFWALTRDRVHSRNTHGTGCTFSAAITAFLARGLSVAEAVKKAKEFVTTAIAHSLDIGRGCGPTNHMAWNNDGEATLS